MAVAFPVPVLIKIYKMDNKVTTTVRVYEGYNITFDKEKSIMVMLLRWLNRLTSSQLIG